MRRRGALGTAAAASLIVVTIAGAAWLGGCTPLEHHARRSRAVTSSRSGGVYHTVRKGETLWRISRTYGVSISEITEANGLADFTIRTGQKLYVPGASKVRETSPITRTTREDVGEPTNAKLAWPLAGRGRGAVTSGFGNREDPILGTTEFHKGIDIDGAREERVLAAQDGEVVFAGSMSGYGTVVMIDHAERLITVYAHLSREVVNLEDRVTQGQTIGYVGSTGRATGTHLHFEVRYKGVPVDPLDYLP